MSESKADVLSFIRLIRDSCPEIQTVIFTQGACYQFHLILKSRFPKAVAYYNGDHVVSRIGDAYFDITGEVAVKADEYYEPLQNEPTDWGRRASHSGVIALASKEPEAAKAKG